MVIILYRGEAKEHRYWEHMWIIGACFGVTIPHAGGFVHSVSKGELKN